jgi:hypothetical protein
VKPPVVILCGGRGTRLRERYESVPKDDEFARLAAEERRPEGLEAE